MKHLKLAYTTLLAKHGMGAALFVAISVTLWVVVFITLPQLSMLDYSFRFNLPADQIGTEADHYTLEQYRSFFFNADGSFNTLDITILIRTLIAALIVTLIDVLICYPIAYILAHGAKGVAARLMVIGLIIPYWINEILRAFAFRVLFGSTGVVNTWGMQMGLWDAPVDFIRADVALYCGLAYAYILLMVFPMYNAIEALDHTQVEACPRHGRAFVAGALAGGLADGETRHRLGGDDGFHADRRGTGRAANPGRAVVPLVHAAHLSMV